MTLAGQDIGTKKSLPRIIGRHHRIRVDVITDEAVDWLGSTTGEFNLYEFDPALVESAAVITKPLGAGLTLLSITDGFRARVVINPNDQTTIEPATYFWSIDLTSSSGVFDQIASGKFQFTQGGT